MYSGASFPLPPGVATSTVMDMPASFPEELQVQVVNDAMNHMDELAQKAQGARSQEGLVRRFKNMRAEFLRPGGLFAEQMARGGMPATVFQTRYTFPGAKPVSSVPPLRSLKPMVAAELEVTTTHRGRYLCGWVAVDDAFFGTASTTLLVEDITGQLVEVGVYGLADPNLPARERQRRVESMFPKGKAVVIVEPFYKVRQDMTEGIRIDEPRELAEWQAVPKDLMTWKQLGNDYFGVLSARNQGRGALACYQRALEAAKADIQALAVLLNNISACRLKTGDVMAAVQLAGAAAHLDPGYLKAWLRLSTSLGEAGRQRVGDRRGGLIAERVVAHASNAMSDLTPKQQRMLERTITWEEKREPEAEDRDRLQSYAEWCVAFDLLALVLASPVAKQASLLSADASDADTWRKKGSEHFVVGGYQAAEECYLRGVAARAVCRRDVSIVLNNIANVHLMVHRESSDVPGISTGGVMDLIATMEDLVPRMELALLNCTVAGIIDPLNAKAWVRRSRCMRKAEFNPSECISDLEAVHACIEGVDKREQELKRLLRAEIKKLKPSNNARNTSSVSDVSTEAQREQRDAGRPENLKATAQCEVGPDDKDLLGGDKSESIDEYIARMEDFSNISQFAFAAAKSKHQLDQLPREIIMKATKPPPQVHVQFPKLRGWPDGIDAAFTRKVLYRAYLDAEAQPWSSALVMRQSEYYQNISPADLFKRWHGIGAMEILRAKTNVKFGDIIDGRKAMSDFVPAYDARIRSNFANNPNRAEVYFFGTTHVAIGFNDFSSLLSASLRDKAGAEGPLRFVGFEMSEFAVAKCRVVAHMLASSNVAITSVMEVWLSSTWSEATLRDFRKSVSMVLVLLEGQEENVKVLSYLRHWASAETISAPKARNEFFLNLERYNSKTLSALFCFRREIDQLEVTEYMLTGEIRASSSALHAVTESEAAATVNEGVTEAATPKKKRNRKKDKKAAAAKISSTPLVGSLTMWNVPAGAPPLDEEIAFNTVDFMTLVDDYAKLQKSRTGDTDKLSVVDLFVVHILKNLARLRALILQGKLTIEVAFGVVKAVREDAAVDVENHQLLSRIASLRPYTISWSNVLDYFLPKDFHDLARRCSVHGDCVHYGYSMNWPTQVYGASIMDFDPELHREFFHETLDSALGFGGQSAVDSLKMMGLDKLVLLPIHEHPLDGTGYVLGQVFKEKWIAHFLSKGEVTPQASRRLSSHLSPTNSDLQPGSMDLWLPSPLYHTSLTMYLSWTYDPELRLQAAQNPFGIGVASDKDMLADMFKGLSADEKDAFWADVQTGR